VRVGKKRTEGRLLEKGKVRKLVAEKVNLREWSSRGRK